MGQGNDASCERANRSGLGDEAGDDESELHNSRRSALDGVLQMRLVLSSRWRLQVLTERIMAEL